MACHVCGEFSIMIYVQVPIGGGYRLIDVPMSNCINSGINKIFVLTQFNSTSLNRHISRSYSTGNGVNFGNGNIEVNCDVFVSVSKCSNASA